MYIKKIELELGYTMTLLDKGKCVLRIEELAKSAKRDVYVGEVFELKGLSGFLVRVDSQLDGAAVLNKVENASVGVGRRRSASIRKVSIKSRLDNGAFIGGASKFGVGEEVSVCEMYSYLCNVIEKKEGKGAMEAFKRKVAEGHGVDVARIGALSGWNNRTYVKPELMPRKVRIESAEIVNVQDISDDDWHLIGVDWMSEEFAIPKKADYVGKLRWATNAKMVLYRYSTISGSVQNDMDLLTYEQRKALVADRLRKKE